MTRHPSTIHVRPLDATGDHAASQTCRCNPIQATDMLEPGRVVIVHRRMPDVPDVPPPGADSLLWRSRARRDAP
jgi:hypothetical protein